MASPPIIVQKPIHKGSKNSTIQQSGTSHRPNTTSQQKHLVFYTDQKQAILTTTPRPHSPELAPQNAHVHKQYFNAKQN